MEQGVVPVNKLFDMLQAEIETTMVQISLEVQNAITSRDFDRAEHLVDDARLAEIISEKLNSLRDEWQQIGANANLPITSQDSSSSLPTSLDSDESIANETRRRSHQRRRHLGSLEDGERTPKDAFRIPLLKELVRVGGRAQSREINKAIYMGMSQLFKPADFEPTKVNKMQVRWQNALHWCRQTLVDEGLMRSDSPRGIWEISDSGRAWLTAHESDENLDTRPAAN